MKPFALLLMSTLKVQRFDDHSGLLTAVEWCDALGLSFEVLKWNEQSGEYARCELPQI